MNESVQRIPKRRIEERPQPFHVDLAEVVHMAPVAHLRGTVDDDINSLCHGLERGRAREVAANDLHAEPFEKRRISAHADEGADRIAAPGEHLGHVRTNEARRAGDENGMGHRGNPSR